MRVLVVSGWYPSAASPGRGSFVADQVRALREFAGVDIVVASWEPSRQSLGTSGLVVREARAGALGRGELPLATPRTWGGGAPVARLPATVPAEPELRHPADLMAWQASTLVPFGRRLARDWAIDLIHAHRGLPDGGAAALLAEALGVPLLTTEHDGSLDERLATPRAVTAYRGLVGDRRGLVAVSRRLADQAAALSGLDPDVIGVIPNLVDRSMFRPRPGLERAPLELLWVGSRKTSKGMDALIRAVALVRGTQPVRLRLIGRAVTEEEDRRLVGLAKELGVASWIAFEPPADRPAVAEAMARATLFVHPSPSESFGIVAVEAMATGLPVVAVSPTVGDLVGRDGVAGEVATGPDAGALAAAIERALDRLASFDRAGIVARTEPYGSDRVAAAITDRYTELVGRASGSVGVAAAAPGPDRSVSPGARPGAAFVLAMRRRSAIQRVSELPPGVASTLTVLTSIGRGDPPGQVGRWIEIDPNGEFQAAMARLGDAGRPARGGPGRWLAAARHPLRTVERRRLVSRRTALLASATATALLEVLSGLADGTPIVALDGEDVAMVVAAGLESRLAPALLWWLADREDALRPVAGTGTRLSGSAGPADPQA